jgi:hypothetical protein
MPRIYDNADAVQALATQLIPTYHPELATARIRYVFCDKAGMKGGKPVNGKVRKISGVLEYLLDVDFLMEVGLDRWNEMTAEQRTALVDHLLECCWGEEDEEDAGAPMKWTLREPDVREFSSILRRHGAWNDDLAGFTSIAKEIDLQAIVSETSTEATQQQTTRA